MRSLSDFEKLADLLLNTISEDATLRGFLRAHLAASLRAAEESTRTKFPATHLEIYLRQKL